MSTRAVLYDTLAEAFAAHPELQATVQAQYRACTSCNPGMMVVSVRGRTRVVDLAHDDDCPRLGQPMLRVAKDRLN